MSRRRMVEEVSSPKTTFSSPSSGPEKEAGVADAASEGPTNEVTDELQGREVWAA